MRWPVNSSYMDDVRNSNGNVRHSIWSRQCVPCVHSPNRRLESRASLSLSLSLSYSLHLSTKKIVEIDFRNGLNFFIVLLLENVLSALGQTAFSRWIGSYPTGDSCCELHKLFESHIGYYRVDRVQQYTSISSLTVLDNHMSLKYRWP